MLSNLRSIFRNKKKLKALKVQYYFTGQATILFYQQIKYKLFEKM